MYMYIKFHNLKENKILPSSKILFVESSIQLNILRNLKYHNSLKVDTTWNKSHSTLYNVMQNVPVYQSLFNHLLSRTDSWRVNHADFSHQGVWAWFGPSSVSKVNCHIHHTIHHTKGWPKYVKLTQTSRHNHCPFLKKNCTAYQHDTGHLKSTLFYQPVHIFVPTAALGL